MNPFKELQKLFKRSSLKDSTFDKERNSITIKGIHNSSIEINLWDEDDLKELRKHLEKSLQKRFDQIIAALKGPKIKHFFSIDELKTSTPNHRLLFKNNLVFFTEEEIEAHYQIIQHLQEDRAALLVGFPATGKSIAVIDIAAKLALEGYSTYYFSFKKIKHWPEIWTELTTHANEKTVFVLDDVHLDPETAGTTLNRLSKNPALNILFISREIYKNRNFTDTLNIYKELDSQTVKTAQPNINKKVEGIVKLYQAYYQKETQGIYPIGDFDQINKNVHRNLIVLNAYLKHWKNHPRLELSALKESELYQGIFDEYFQNLEIKTRIVLLQYLCLYYFEIEFYANPKEDKATQQLLDKAIIAKDKGDLYSIYHGEYALLLLKAFRFAQKKQFYRLGNSWSLFFANQIKQYLKGFTKDPNTSHNPYYPDNLLEILTAIPRFTKEVHGGIEDTNSIFKSLVESPSIQKVIQQSCREENDDQTIAFFLYSILYNCPNQFESFFRAFSTKVFENKYALLIYCKAYKALYLENQLDWFEAYSDSHFPLIIENSLLHRLGYALSLYKPHHKIAQSIYSKVFSSDIISKIENANLQEIGQALNRLNSVDDEKTKKIYTEINTNKEHFKKKILQANLQEIGQALNRLNSVDHEKTKKIYAEININEEHFRKKIVQANLLQLSLALSRLNKINPIKTKEIYKGVNINEEHFKKKILQATFLELGLALNKLHSINFSKTEDIYDIIDINKGYFKKMVLQVDFAKLGLTLNQLNKIDPIKTKEIYKGVNINEEHFKKKILQTNLQEIGKALNQLNKIDPIKTKKIYEGVNINEEHFRKIVLKINLNKLSLVLSQLKSIDLGKTKDIYDIIDINKSYFKNMVLQVNLNKLSLALNQLKPINYKKTKNIYNNIDINKGHFEDLIFKASFKGLGEALNQLNNIDSKKTEKFCTLSIITILNKVKNSSLKYRDFILQISLLSRVLPTLGINSYQSISKDRIYQFDKLKDIYTFNLLAQYLLNINLSFQDKNFIKVIEFGVKNVSNFLKTPIHAVSTYIGIMAKLNQNISKQIEKNIPRYTRSILKKDNENRVPRLIANIFMHSQSIAIDILLDTYQFTYPDDKVMVIKTYIEIAKNKAQQGDKQTATGFLKKAQDITQNLDNQDFEQIIIELIKEYDLDI